MIHIRVQYDADTRTFKLIDKEFRTILEGDALYDLALPLTLYTLASPASFWAAASTAGDMARHGPHQGAQKSTRMGSLDWISSSSSAASLRSRTYWLM